MPDYSFLYSKYHSEQKTLREIASCLGVSHCTVIRWMRFYNIPTNRTKGPKSKRFPLNCELCGKEIKRVPSTTSKRNFCSYDCYHKWMVGNTSGEQCNNWRGGITAISSDNLKTIEFRNMKKVVLQKFPVCTLCGNDKTLHVHHIHTRREYPQLTFELSNLITLCRSCHSHIKGKEKEWASQFNEIVNGELQTTG